MSECCRKIGLSEIGANGRQQIRKRCKELNIDYTRLSKTNPPNRIIPNKRELEEVLVENSTYTNRTALKARLLKEGLITYECAICKNKGEWNGNPLTLQLDHINGINNDHRLENLRFLCPNCHSQTNTFSGRNKR